MCDGCQPMQPCLKSAESTFAVMYQDLLTPKDIAAMIVVGAWAALWKQRPGLDSAWREGM